MKTNQTHLSRISNNIFIIFAIFSLIFIWLNYYLRNLTLSLYSSIVIVLFFCVIYYPIKFRINKKNNSKQNTLLNKENLKTQLLFNKISENIELISKAFNLVDLTPTQDNNHFLANNSEDIFLIFNKEMITEEDITSAIKNRENDNVTIFCISATKFVELNSLTIKIIELRDIYKKLDEKKIKIYNNINIKKSTKLRAFDYFCIILCKERSRGYLGFGLLLIFSSLFTIYHTYYIVIGTVLILLSIYTRFNKRFN